MNQSAMLARFAREADFDCFLLAGRYTLLDQEGLHELAPSLRPEEDRRQSPAASTTAASSRTRPWGRPFNYQPAPPQLVDSAAAARSCLRTHGVPAQGSGDPVSARAPSNRVRRDGGADARRARGEHQDDPASDPGSLWEELRADGLVDERAPIPA